MSFKVNSGDVRGYFMALLDLYDDVGWAQNYVHSYGDFSFHQSGIIGTLAGQHTSFMNQLDQLHDRLEVILFRSGEALTAIADTYQETDEATSARIDASYPASPRPTISRD